MAIRGEPSDHGSPRLYWLGNRLVLSAVVVLIGVLRVACTYHPPTECGDYKLETAEGFRQTLDCSALKTATEGHRDTIVADKNGLTIQHGYACAKASGAVTGGGRHLGIHISDSAEIPKNFDATVFLNGWNLQYTDDDHHVLGLGSVIYNIAHAQEGGKELLTWDAGGALGDHNGDDSYQWCYYYTLVFWPKGNRFVRPFDINATVSDPTNALVFVDGGAQSPVAPSIRSIDGSFGEEGRDHRKKLGSLAVLPAGFALSWTDDDHHVLQVGFDLGFLLASAKPIAWRSVTLLKDNSKSHTYRTGEIVSILGGNSVHWWEPSTVVVKSDSSNPVEQSNHMDLAPHSKSSCPGACVGCSGSHEYELAVKDVPFDYAVPVLSGWEISNICEDHHVKMVGAWVAGFNYQKTPGSKTGTLHCTIRSRLFDDPTFATSIRGSNARLQLTVLGINRVGQLTLPFNPQNLPVLQQVPVPTATRTTVPTATRTTVPTATHTTAPTPTSTPTSPPSRRTPTFTKGPSGN